MTSPFDDEEDAVPNQTNVREEGRTGFSLAVDGYHTHTDSRVVVPDGVVRICDGAFSNHEEITEIVLPDSLEAIGAKAFSGCSGLREVVVPPHVSMLGGHAFTQCTSLERVSLPDSLTTIAEETFHGCKTLSEVRGGAGVVKVARDAFLGCTNLDDASVNALLAHVSEIGRGAFAGCSALCSVQLAAQTTAIGSEAFRGCSGLQAVRLPSTINSLGDNLFVGCFALDTIDGADSYVTEYPGAFPRAFVEECGLVRPQDIKVLQAEYRQAHSDDIIVIKKMIEETKAAIIGLDSGLDEEGLLRLARKRQMADTYDSLRRRLQEQEDMLESFEHPSIDMISAAEE